MVVHELTKENKKYHCASELGRTRSKGGLWPLGQCPVVRLRRALEVT